MNERALIEQTVLAYLLLEPEGFAWETAGIDPRLFAMPAHRAIADALRTLATRGRRIHWRRVRVLLRKRGQNVAAEMVDPLRRGVGTTSGMDWFLGELRRLATTRAA